MAVTLIPVDTAASASAGSTVYPPFTEFTISDTALGGFGGFFGRNVTVTVDHFLIAQVSAFGLTATSTSWIDVTLDGGLTWGLLGSLTVSVQTTSQANLNDGLIGITPDISISVLPVDLSLIQLRASTLRSVVELVPPGELTAGASFGNARIDDWTLTYDPVGRGIMQA